MRLVDVAENDSGWKVFQPYTERRLKNFDREWYQFWRPSVRIEHLEVITLDGKSHYRWVCKQSGLKRYGHL